MNSTCRSLGILIALSLSTLAGCSDKVGGGTGRVDLPLSVCEPQNGPFSLTIDNPYFPLPVGTQYLYQGVEDGTVIDLTITVLNETKVVNGVTTRVMEERELEDDELIEISRNFFAQAPDGTVCYFGEEVDIYEGGQLASHDGAWLAGNGNRAGILMPGNPEVGMTYQQELATGVAMDRGEIVAVGVPFTAGGITFSDTVLTIDTSPLEPGVQSEKTYARGIGLVFDEPVSLVGMPSL